MQNEYNVGVTYLEDLVDEYGLKDKIVGHEINNLAAKHRNGTACSGNFPGVSAHECFRFFNLEGALGFMMDTCDKPYIVSETLIREDKYKEIRKRLQIA